MPIQLSHLDLWRGVVSTILTIALILWVCWVKSQKLGSRIDFRQEFVYCNKQCHIKWLHVAFTWFSFFIGFFFVRILLDFFFMLQKEALKIKLRWTECWSVRVMLPFRIFLPFWVWVSAMLHLTVKDKSMMLKQRFYWVSKVIWVLMKIIRSFNFV